MIKETAQHPREVLTSEAFTRRYGEVLNNHFSSLVAYEATLARQRPELFVIEPQAHINLNDLQNSGLNIEAIEEAWQRRKNEWTAKSEIRLEVGVISNIRTNLIYIFKKLEGLQKEEGEVLIFVNNIDLGLLLRLEEGRLEKRTYALSEEQMIELTGVLLGVFSEGKADMTEEDIQNMEKKQILRKGSQLALQESVFQSPEQLVSIFDQRKVGITTQRLMMQEEMQSWENMVAQLREKGEMVQVIKVLYGGNLFVIWRIEQTSFGPAISREYFDSKWQPLHQVEYNFPLEVRSKENERLGWLLCEHTVEDGGWECFHLVHSSRMQFDFAQIGVAMVD